MLASATFGEIRYCLFVSTPGIKIMSESERKDYVYSAVLRNEALPIMRIDIDYDSPII
jgi:hypothetical protein